RTRSLGHARVRSSAHDLRVPLRWPRALPEVRTTPDRAAVDRRQEQTALRVERHAQAPPPRRRGHCYETFAPPKGSYWMMPGGKDCLARRLELPARGPI